MTMADGRFAGRSAVVTGAGSGIGRAIALRLAAEGAQVLAAGRTVSTLEETKVLAQTPTGAGSILVQQCDIGDEAAVADLESVARAAFGGLDVLVANAGVSTGGGHIMHEVGLADLDAAIATNVRGCFLVMQAGIRLMLGSGGGAIVVVGSLGALRPAPRAAAYGLSKITSHAMTRHAALDYAADGIRVNAIAPGSTDTPMMRSAPPDVRAKISKAIPLGRMASPDEIAAVAVFLASDEASFVTGQIWAVDGGSGLATS